jgi:hypothetical protein
MNRVVKEVLLFYPGLLQKRLIVFPTNLRNNHWGATFVFNAGDIVAATDDVSCLRTSFFAIAVFIPLAQQKFQIASVLSGSSTLPSVTRNKGKQVQTIAALQTR